MSDLANAPITCPPLPTYVERLRWWAAHDPAGRAFAFTHDGVTDEDVTTFERLEFLARRTAAVLQDGGSPGDRVLNLCSPGVHFQASLYAPMFAEQVVVPFVLPRPGQSPATLAAVLGRVRPAALLVTAADVATLDGIREAIPALEGIRVIVTDDLPDEVASNWREVVPDPDDLACLILTSGSTSIPQCVMRTHRRLIDTLGFRPELMSRDRSPRIAVGAPHTMAGITQSLPVVHVGAPTTFMSFADVLAHPVAWLRAISRPGVWGGGTGNHILDLCVRTVTEDEKRTIDLSHVEILVVVGEETHLSATQRFAEAFAICGFSFDRFACSYGMTEGSGISFTPLEQSLRLTTFSREALQVGRVETVPEGSPASRTVVAQGKLLSGQTVRIVEPTTRLECPPNRVGEIWVSGPTVANGYWDQPEETEHTFHARLAGTGEGPFLRTGDLGFLLDGNLYVIDRVKDVIIIRGRNLSPGDIEGQMRTVHPDLTGHAGAACAIRVDGEERLLLVQELSTATSEGYADISRAMRASVAREFGVQPYDVVLVPAGSLPRTESGKAQRGETRRRYEARALPVLYQSSVAEIEGGEAIDDVAPSEVEGIILAIWRRVLGRQTITVYDSFGAVGGDSISAMRVLAGIRQAGFSLAVNDFWRAETVAALARMVRRDEPDPVARPDEPVALTIGQCQIFRAFAPGRIRHTFITCVLIPTEVLDADILRAAIDSVVAAHEGLRTTFENDGGVVRTVLGKRVDRPLLRIVELPENVEVDRELLLAEEASTARARISIEQGPLVQCVLLRNDDPTACRFVIAAHHLVTDALSMQILLEDIESAYRSLAAGNTPHVVRTTSLGEYGRQLEEYIRSHEYVADLAFWEGDAEVTRITEVAAPPWPFPQPRWSSRVDMAARMAVRVLGMRRIASALFGRLRRPQVHDRLTLEHVLEPVTSTGLLEAAAHLSVPPPAVVVYALTRAVYRLTGSTDQRHMIVGHGRAPVRPETDLSRTVSLFRTTYPFALHLDPDAPVVDELHAVQRRLESIPRGGLAAALTSVGSRSTPATVPDDVPHLVINFQGSYSKGEAGLFAVVSDPRTSDQARVATSGLPMIWVHCNVRDGCIGFACHHNVARYSVSMVDQLIATVMDELRHVEAALTRDPVALQART
jgi:acyl-CoA synthetase (AMP-forming)/AMP-acid ligase II